MFAHEALVEALWSKPELLKAGINNQQVHALANATTEFLAEKHFAILSAEDMWAFDDELNDWLLKRRGMGRLFCSGHHADHA